MESTPPKPELLVIVGPTASGKSQLAMRIATEYNGEIIAADSRTIYKGMDIGTAKPTKSERAIVPHWGLDLINPGQLYSAARFKKYTEDKLKKIKKRQNLPILVGGTGLYVDSVIYDFSFVNKSKPKLRLGLENMSIDELHRIIKKSKYSMPENFSNRRHLMAVIEREGQIGGKNASPIPGTFLIGILPSDKEIKRRISERAEAIFKSSIDKEAERLLAKYGEKALMATGGIVYRIWLKLIRGEITKPVALEMFKNADWQYARRQKTWFKRNPDIQWFSSAEAAFQEVTSRLNT